MSLHAIIDELIELNISLKAEGDEIRLNGSREKLTPAIIERIKINKPELLKFLQSQSQQQVRENKIPLVALSDSYTLSSSQRRMWILSQFAEANAAYNVQGTLTINGGLRLDALEYAFQMLIERHESFRTVFRVSDDGEVRQVILAKDELGFAVSFISSNDFVKGERNEILEKALLKPFDLEQGPLVRVTVVQTGDEQCLLCYAMHHIISDGWSTGIMLRELFQLYNAFIEGRTVELPALRIQYKDYAHWQNAELRTGGLLKQKEYWLEQFKEDIPVLELPTDRVRPSIKSYNGGSLGKHFDSQKISGLRALCRQNDVTLFMGLLSLVNVLLYRYTGHEDIVVGCPVAGRNHIDIEDQIGFYLNMLPLRTKFRSSDSFQDILTTVKRVTLEGYANQSYPFDVLIDDLNIQRDLSRDVLFDVMIVLQNAADNNTSGIFDDSNKPADVTNISRENVFSRYDLTFNFLEDREGLNLRLEFNSDLFDRGTISRLGEHIATLIDSIASNANVAIEKLSYLTPSETYELLKTFNDTKAEYPRSQTLTGLFENQVSKTPNATSLEFAGKSFTYAQLNSTANQLGHYLRSQYGISPNDLIAVKLKRSEWMIIALLGVLKSGGAYVPIDPDYPQERVDFIMVDGGIKAMIDETELLKFQNISANYPSINPPATSTAADLAYVIYTSGSTGVPKGCMLRHQGVVNRIDWMWQQYNFSSVDIILQKTTFTFDVSVWEIFMPLCWGAKMVLCEDDDVKLPSRIVSIIEQNKITCLHFVPSQLNVFLATLKEAGYDGAQLSSLRQIITSGEALSVDTASEWYSTVNAPIHNLYGPTEASIDVTHYTVINGDVKIPIGRPIWNTQMYVVDKGEQLVPVGVVGEICAGGDGVALGYLNNSQLTSQKFIPNPFKKGDVLYKTGDLGRWLPDGNIEYIGRRDHQVKIRGFRIELGEIESVLKRDPAVLDAVVVAKKNAFKEDHLVAYIVAPAPLNLQDVRSFLSERLPAYMIPSYFIQLSKLPFTSNGKLDRKSLPEIDGAELLANDFTPAVTKLEKSFAAIWCDILGVKRVGLRDNFFESGGDSIKVLRMVASVRKETGLAIKAADVYKFNSIESILSHVEKNKGEFDLKQQAHRENHLRINETLLRYKEQVLANHERFDADNIDDIYPMSAIEKGMIFGYVANEGTGIYHDQFIYQRAFIDFDFARFVSAFEKMIAKHEILRTTFHFRDRNSDFRVVYKKVDLPIRLHDISMHSGHAQNQLFTEFTSAEISKFFKAELAPLWKMDVFRLGKNNFGFVWQFHHAILDGWSNASFVTELNNIYIALKENPLYTPSPLKASYKDFIIQHEIDNRDERNLNFWKRELLGYKSLNLFTGGDEVTKYSESLGVDYLNNLKKFASANNTSVKIIALTAYVYLLKILSGSNDVITGLVTNTRPEVEDGDKVLGCFLNTLPFRLHVSETMTPAELLSLVKQKVLEIKEHEKLSLLEIALKLNEAKEGNPFFDVLFNFVDFHVLKSAQEEEEAVESTEQVIDLPARWERTNTFMDIAIGVTGGYFNINFTLGRKLNSVGEIQGVATIYKNVLNFLIDRLNEPFQNLDYLSQAEKFQEISAFSAKHAFKTNCIDFFHQQALKHSSKSAFEKNGQNYTYEDLWKSSGRYCNYLKTKHGIKPKQVVGVKLDKKPMMIIAILGALRAGAKVLLTSKSQSYNQIEHVMKESQCALILSEEALIDSLKDIATSHDENSIVENHSQRNLLVYLTNTNAQNVRLEVSSDSLLGFIFWGCQTEELSSGKISIEQIDLNWDCSINGLHEKITSFKRSSINTSVDSVSAFNSSLSTEF